VTHPIRKQRLGSSYQTAKVTHPIRQCRLDFFEQTEAQLFRSDWKDMALPIKHWKLDFANCQCPTWRKRLQI